MGASLSGVPGTTPAHVTRRCRRSVPGRNDGHEHEDERRDGSEQEGQQEPAQAAAVLTLRQSGVDERADPEGLAVLLLLDPTALKLVIAIMVIVFTLLLMGGLELHRAGVLGDLAAGEHEFTFATHGGAAIEIDGFALPADDAPIVRFIPVHWQPQPAILPGPHPRSLLLRYPALDHWYGLAWDAPADGDDAEVRAFHTSRPTR